MKTSENINELAPAPLPVTPMAMIDRAIAGGASVETLERLMALQERWEATEARREFDEAMASAKAAIKPIIKNRHVKYEGRAGGTSTEYAHEDMAGIAEAIDPILTGHGLSYRYQAKQDGMMVSVTCIISHRRGHREETTLTAGADNSGSKNAIQAVGSTVTYLQRYTLKLALGLAAARDTDGNGGGGNGEIKLIDEAQYRYLADLIEKAGADEAKLLIYLKAAKLETLTQAQYRTAEAALRKKIADKDKKKEAK
jgi:hypothetical protein